MHFMPGRNHVPRALGLSVLAALLILVPLALAWARPLPSATRPDLIAPLADVTQSESGLTFAWRTAPGTDRHYLLWSEREFDTAPLRALPAGGDIHVVASKRGIVEWSALGERLTSDTRLYWAAADIGPTGQITFSPVRTLFVLRRFANQAERSPLVAVSPIGTTATHGAEPLRRCSKQWSLRPAKTS